MLEPYTTFDGREIVIVAYEECPTCDYPRPAPITEEGICLNCDLAKNGKF